MFFKSWVEDTWVDIILLTDLDMRVLSDYLIIVIRAGNQSYSNYYFLSISFLTNQGDVYFMHFIKGTLLLFSPLRFF